MRSEIIVLKNTIFWYKIRIFGCQNTNFCFSKLAGLYLRHFLLHIYQMGVVTTPSLDFRYKASDSMI